jgi:L-ribulose-5-phosphate 3-epimerase
MVNADIMPLGVMTSLGDDPMAAFKKVREFGFRTCQLSNPPQKYVYGPEADKLTATVGEALAETGVRLTSVFIMFKGHIWNRVDGPRTIGFVPEGTRATRAIHACRISDWARSIGLDAVCTHVGFIPEDPNDPVYAPLVDFLREFARYCKDNGQWFIFETGQETPRTLRRTIDDIALDNLGINLDPANLLLYGKGRPLEAVEIFGEFVRNTHCKDGLWPEDGVKLGRETPLGEGNVHFDTLIPALHAKGYRGPLTIEREISGPQQAADILRAKGILEAIKAGIAAA